MNSIGTQLPFAIDGNAGGTYTPSAPIVIGGITLDGNNLYAIGIISTTSTVVGDIVQGTSDLISLGSFLSVGTSTFTGTATFNGLGDFADGLHVGTSGVVLIERATTITQSLTQQGTAQFEAAVTAQDKIDLSTGTGRLVERVVYAPDADHTYAATDATVIVYQSGVVTGTHTYKLNDAAAVGQKLKLVNCTLFDQNLQNSGGGAIILAPLLPAAAAFVPGVVDLLWVNNGTYVGWTQVGA
jgi:hypothetical protein